ncbi:sensor histidine kinase [Paenibacillus sp. HJGM_3]|uniref:sensor histidine kinase n=1 Tax=Paenibacillus sp. HJGM_3 TaxID=3379816 RepID=UPI00385F181A
MQKWHHIFHKSTGLSPYVWVVFYILPFYFILRSSSMVEIGFGIAMILVFFVCYVMSFITRGWWVYFWSGLQILISITMTVQFGYVYFALFLAFFIGNVQHFIGFVTLYSIHLLTTIAVINYGFVTQNPMLLSQLPFVLVSLIGVILLPVTTYTRNRREKLQGQLEDANKKISELIKLEERQRIARDLHDTLGQQLSLIGLKSDLAAKLIGKNPAQAQAEMNDIRQTARIALKEVRELVTELRGTRLEDELYRVAQILKAADIELILEGDRRIDGLSLMAENVLSMCLREAVTNVVKHSGATACTIRIEASPSELVIQVKDNGVGMTDAGMAQPDLGGKCNGLRGMRERLEFVNGVMEIVTRNGSLVNFRVPIVSRQNG